MMCPQMSGRLLAQDQQGPIAFLHKEVGSFTITFRLRKGKESLAERSRVGAGSTLWKADKILSVYTPRLHPQIGWVFLSPIWLMAYRPGCFPSWKLLRLEEKKEARGGASCDVWKPGFPRLLPTASAPHNSFMARLRPWSFLAALI